MLLGKTTVRNRRPSYALAFIKSTLVNSSEEFAVATRRLNHAVHWKSWKKRYDIMQKRIHTGTFAWHDPSSHTEPRPSHVMKAIKESFAINSPSNVTQRFISKKLKEFKRTLHSDKVVCLPPRQRHLAKLITAALELMFSA